MTEKKKLRLEGPPDKVIGELMYDHGDPFSAAIASLLVDFETGHDTEAGWDRPPMLLTCYRNLPPETLADRFSEHGVTALMLGVRQVPIPEAVFTNHIPLYRMLQMLAETLVEHHEEMMPTLAKLDLVAWILVCEAWVSTVSRADFEVAKATGKPKIQPSDDPNRKEARMVYAVDRAGYRYTLTRDREDNETRMWADQGGPTEKGELGMTGRLLEALQAVMEATPETPVDA